MLQARNAQSEISASDLRFPDSVSSRPRYVPTGSDLDQVEKRAILHALEDNGGNQGKAAEALGISRRTLIRKLKVYREAGLEDSSGSLSLSQQRYYRAQLELPIKTKYAGEQFDAVLLNISAGGAGIRDGKAVEIRRSGCARLPDSWRQPLKLQSNFPAALPGPTKAGNTESSLLKFPRLCAPACNAGCAWR